MHTKRVFPMKTKPSTLGYQNKTPTSFEFFKVCNEDEGTAAKDNNVII